MKTSLGSMTTEATLYSNISFTNLFISITGQLPSVT